MKKTYIIIMFALAAITIYNSNSCFAQSDTVKYLKVIEAYGNTIKKPFIIDSLNNHGKAFSLEEFLTIPTLSQMKRDSQERIGMYLNPQDGIMKIKIDTTQKGITIYTYYFELSNSAYTKGKISIYCTEKVKVALDGKEIGKQMKRLDSLSEDSKLDCEVTLEPKGHMVSLSVICQDDRAEMLLRIVVSIPHVKVSNEQDFRRGLALMDLLEGTRPYNVSMSYYGDYYLVKYYTATFGEKNKYRVEVRNTFDSEVIWATDNVTSVKWVAGSLDLYYVKEENKSRNLYIRRGANEVLLAENLPEGKIDWLNYNDGFIFTLTEREDNSKDDLRQLIHPDDRIGDWRNRTYLAHYDLKRSILQPLTFGHHSVTLCDISDDSKRIVFAIHNEDITKRPFSTSTFCEMNLESLEVDTLFSDSFVSDVKYMRGEKWERNFIVTGSGEAFGSCGSEVKKGQIPNVYNKQLFLFERQTKQAKPLLKGFKPSVDAIKVTKDGRIFLTTTDRDSINVYCYDFDSIYRLPLEVDVVLGFDIDDEGEHAVYFGQNYNKSDRVFVYDVYSKLSTVVSYPKQDMNKSLSLGEMRVWNFKHKGDQIEGRYYLPADFDSTKQYPMLVYYYGGTTPTDRTFEMRYSAWLYTSLGYVFYVLNPSGATGYGQEFAARHVNAWGERTADEIIAGVKQFCKEHSFIDRKRIGCFGASYGGFITQLLQTKTDIFAAAISHAGISDITSYWGEGYWGYSYSAGASAHSYPWNNKELYVEHSPLFSADKIKTPLLLLHGTDDTNVPIGESIQMFNALKLLGKEVELITVKGENHGINDHKKRLAWNNTIFAWFAKWLQNDPSWWEALYPKKNL